MENCNGAAVSGFRRSRGVNWTEEETEQLLEAWADKDVQSLLENGPHNRQAFERVSFNLTQHQMDKTPSQCREKIKKLKTIYRNLNSGHGKVSKKIQGRLVHKLHQVMGGTANLTATEKVSDPNQEETTDRQTAQLPDEFAQSFQGAIDPDYLPDSSSTALSSDQESLSSDKTNSTHQRSQRKKKTKTKHKSSAIYLLIEKVITAQSSINERFAALEERRLVVEKELEEKRIEAEARRQESQRQHELRLLSTMAQQMASVFKSLNPLTRCETAVSETDAVGHPVSKGPSTGCDYAVHQADDTCSYSTM